MGIGEKLRIRRQELNITRSDLAKKIHVTPSAIANYENGISYPKPDILIALIQTLGIDANYLYQDYLPSNQVQSHFGRDLTPAEIDAIKKYRVLTEQSKRLIRMIIHEEYERNLAEEWIEFPCLIPGVRKINTGFLLQDDCRSIKFKRKYELEGMDFCFQVQIDNYQPVFKKYDILALKRTPAEHNEIGLFRLNDIYYIRALYQTHSLCRLCSLNVVDPDIIVAPSDRLECLGTVLGRIYGACEFVSPD